MSYKIWKNNTWIECAGQPDLTAFQKKLIAGTGIKIDQETNVISADGLADGNVAYDTETKTLYVKKDGSYLAITDIDLVTQEKERAELAESGKLDLLGDVPGWAPGTNPYKVSYYYEMIPGANGITVKAKTISLDNKKTQGEYSLEVPSATTTTAGLMSASDKIKLGNSQTKVVYSSTEPTGAQENDIWIY